MLKTVFFSCFGNLPALTTTKKNTPIILTIFTYPYTAILRPELCSVLVYDVLGTEPGSSVLQAQSLLQNHWTVPHCLFVKERTDPMTTPSWLSCVHTQKQE